MCGLGTNLYSCPDLKYKHQNVHEHERSTVLKDVIQRVFEDEIGTFTGF